MCEVFVLNCPIEKYQKRLEKYDDRYTIFKGTTPDEKQTKFVEEYNKLVTKYATLKQNKEQ